MPVVQERFARRGKKDVVYLRIVIKEFKEIQGGVWVPTRISVTDPIMDGEFAGHPHSEMIGEVNLQKSRWNIDIPEDTFALSFPAGTRVLDVMRKAMYTTGNPDSGKNLKALAKGARDFLFFHEPAAIPAIPWWRTATFFWVVAGAILLAILSLSAWYWRKRRVLQS